MAGDERSKQVQHLIITVHGIRTVGQWQDRLNSLLQGRAGVRVKNYKYGFFSSIAFQIPFIRWLVAGRFRDALLDEIKDLPPDAKIHIVAHSFGTYLVARALPHLPENRRLETIIFAGSVLKPTFPWSKYSGRIGRVLNECGSRDLVLILNQSVALGMGMAGRVGFYHFESDQFVNRYHDFNHSDYFRDGGAFMSDHWIPLMIDGTAPPPGRPRGSLGPLRSAWMFLLNNTEIPKMIGVAFLLFYCFYAFPRQALTLQRASDKAKFNSILMAVASAASIPGSNPKHVEELLQKNLDDGYELRLVADAVTKIDVIDRSPVVGGPLLGWSLFYADENQANEAMQLHAKANRELMVAEQSKVPDLTKARDYFERAEKMYAGVEHRVPAPYFLCLLDHGRLLSTLKNHRAAIEKFKIVRSKVVDQDPSLLREAPQSLKVDSLCAEALALGNLLEWDEAEKRLQLAKTIADEPEDDALHAQIFNEKAWLCMSRWEIKKAQYNFDQARARCEKLLERQDDFSIKVLLFHVRHGLAMAQRYRGERDPARQAYSQLIADIETVLERDDDLVPKQRKDLRLRLLNSEERRADCDLFDDEIKARQAYDRYEYPCDLAREGEDQTTRARLLYKRYIAGFRAKLKDAKSNDSLLKEADDQLMKEADSVFKGLSPDQRKQVDAFKQVATFCRDYRVDDGLEVERGVRRKRRYSPAHTSTDPVEIQGQARKELRTVLRKRTEELARRPLSRDVVEMYLLASEILLACRDQPPSVEKQEISEREQDVATLLEITGSTVRGGSHPELLPYLKRYSALALNADTPLTKMTEPRPTSRVHQPIRDTQSAAGDDQIVFFLRIRPDITFGVTKGKVGLGSLAMPGPQAPPTLASSNVSQPGATQSPSVNSGSMSAP